jgi:hypothetical protein
MNPATDPPPVATTAPTRLGLPVDASSRHAGAIAVFMEPSSEFAYGLMVVMSDLG